MSTRLTQVLDALETEHTKVWSCPRSVPIHSDSWAVCNIVGVSSSERALVTEHRVPVDGGWIHVRDEGTGSPVVLVASLGRSASDFGALSATLSVAGYRVLAVDLRGVGDSSEPIEGHDLHDIAADVAAVIERLTTGSVHVGGHAFGNRVVRCLAADRPDLVLSVTLFAAGGLVPPAPEVRAAMGRCFANLADPTERIADLQLAFFSKESDASAWLYGWWPAAAKAGVAAVEATPLQDWWNAGPVPVLVIQGLDDNCAVPENGRRFIADADGRGQLVELAGAGHALLPEKPEAVAGAMISFLKSQEVAASAE